MGEMTMPATIIEAAQYRPMPWRNGLGTSLEIAAEASGDGAAWRFGIAAIERSCPFSLYPGYDRTILLLDGAGLVLSFPDGAEPTRRIDDPARPVRFPGDPRTECALLDGPVRVLNVLTDRALISHRAAVLSLAAGPAVCPAGSGPTLVFALAGSIEVRLAARVVVLAPGATLRLDPPMETPPTLLRAATPEAVAYCVTLDPVLPNVQ
jgi:environmental stress-induced protein Ves